MKDAIARQHVELLLLDEDVFKTLSVPHADGAHYLKIVHEKSRPDRLKDIRSPRN